MTQTGRHNRANQSPNAGTAGERLLTGQLVALVGLLAWGLVTADFASGMPVQLRDTLRSNGLSRADYEERERGYYEHLIGHERQLGSIEDAVREKARQSRARAGDAPFDAGPLAMPVDDLREV